MVGLECLAAIESFPQWVLYLCGSLAVLVLGSFIILAVKTWEQIRPSQEEIRERESRRALKLKGSLVVHPPHRPVVENSLVPAFRQAGLGLCMPLMETHPFIYPSGEESEKIDLTKLIMRLLHDGRLVVHETHDGRLIISHRDLENMVLGVVLDPIAGSEGAWRACVEQFGPGSLDEYAEMTAVGDKYANEWVFSFAPIFAVMVAAGHHGVWAGPVPWGAIALTLCAIGGLGALISARARGLSSIAKSDGVLGARFEAGVAAPSRESRALQPRVDA
ncbi:MAG: hypothetical protein IT577_02345 [Verrucomicrobiae bacterium]|nr:hypothetical protein [Verrucomicrobiae bacterium]